MAEVDGVADLNVIQEVAYVEQQAKMVCLLRCLHKTPPPVLIFCEDKDEVDRIHEHLLSNEVGPVAIHEGKDEEMRQHAVTSFRARWRDVLVATDAAFDGLNFHHITHVINYDMPAEMEKYVRRIKQTGKDGYIGMATTFINMGQSRKTLLDLRALLLEAWQDTHPVLELLNEDNVEELEAFISGKDFCAFCGVLGHRIRKCPKFESQNKVLCHVKQYLIFF